MHMIANKAVKVLSPRRNCACLSWESLRRAAVMTLISRQTIGWSGKFINLNKNRNCWQLLAQTPQRALNINTSTHRYTVTHMSYSSLPAEDVLSALRSMMYISYCENTSTKILTVDSSFRFICHVQINTGSTIQWNVLDEQSAQH